MKATTKPATNATVPSSRPIVSQARTGPAPSDLPDCPVHDEDCGLDLSCAQEKARRLAPMPPATDLFAPILDDVVART